MAHTSAAMSSTKRSGKRWRLGTPTFEVRNKWWDILFVWRKIQVNRKIGRGRIGFKNYYAYSVYAHNTNTQQHAHYQLEEKPGVLKCCFPHCAGADHPLQSQLLMKQLHVKQHNKVSLYHHFGTICGHWVKHQHAVISLCYIITC